jgi:hypothetical protein
MPFLHSVEMPANCQQDPSLSLGRGASRKDTTMSNSVPSGLYRHPAAVLFRPGGLLSHGILLGLPACSLR